MSQPELTPPPKIMPKTEWTGALLVSKEELDAAVLEDPWMVKLLDIVEKDKAHLLAIKEQLRIARAEYYRVRGFETRAKARLRARDREIKYFTKALRKRLAWKKIKETREKIGL